MADPNGYDNIIFIVGHRFKERTSNSANNRKRKNISSSGIICPFHASIQAQGKIGKNNTWDQKNNGLILQNRPFQSFSSFHGY